jgi:hypothetical protein
MLVGETTSPAMKGDLTMTELHRTNDEIGVDLDILRPESASATLGTATQEVRLPSREHDGFAAPQLSESERQGVLKVLGIGTPEANLASHVRLDMRQAYVSGKGHINLIRFSHVWSEVPRADWLRWLDVAGFGGTVEMWFDGLTVNKQYLISIAVSGWKLNSSSAFKVGSSAGFYANFPVSQTGQVQYLYGVLTPTSNLALVRLDPIQLDALSFYNVELWPF